MVSAPGFSGAKSSCLLPPRSVLAPLCLLEAGAALQELEHAVECESSATASQALSRSFGDGSFSGTHPGGRRG